MSTVLVEQSADTRSPSVRLARLADPGSLVPLHAADDSGVQAVSGLVGGSPIVAYCTDPRGWAAPWARRAPTTSWPPSRPPYDSTAR